MARFLMWMALFFTMASFWKYMGFAWSTRKDKGFLQVQSEHCKRLCNVIPSLEKFKKNTEASPKTKVLNKNQCIHLFGKLILVMKGIDKMLSNATRDLKFQCIFDELCFLQKKVEIVGKSCTEQDQWCHSAIFQLQNKETFRELLLEMKCCYDTARDLYLFHHFDPSNDILPIQFDAVTYDQVLEDEKELKKKLELVHEGEVSKDIELVQHLLLRLRNLDRVNGGDLDALEVPNDFKPPKLIQKIGSYGDVYRSNWFGLPCATKVLKGNLEYLLKCRKEAGILVGLSHPNLVQFFGCGIIKRIDENMKEDEIGATHLVMQLKKSSMFQMLKKLVQYFGFGITQTSDEIGEMHLVMELMDSNLSTLLKRTKRPIPYLLAIDIMHQIAKGVYHLHDMQVAHLDLNPDNVLSSSILMEGLDPHLVFKVIDYGTSLLEVCSNAKNLEPTKYTIGTPRYMSPEVIKGSKIPLHPFQADAWSFAMICSEILSGKVPYFGFEPKDFLAQITCLDGSTSSESLRPKLPNNCKELTNLIQECWSQDPLQRPTFSNICERLSRLKKSFWKGTFSCKMVPQFNPPFSVRDSKSIVDHVQKVKEQIALPKEDLVDLERQLSKAKALLKLNYIGIVGMGGIGKTTLAKAILCDAKVKSLYNASCFVSQSVISQSLYSMLCEILLKLGNDEKPKNLIDAQEMMKKILDAKNVLLILDDVKEEALVHDIVPTNIVQASKGTTIILTTRNWNTIKSFVGIEGRLDVELLDEKAATELFTTQLSLDISHLSPDFESYCKHVVRACNGLPLSLKVMGSFLRNKEKLRSWEHALQRMARGRNLDGDEEIWNTLKISYDGLNDGVEKNMFLDVACFFCRDVYPSGISKETILYMWSKNGILPMDELDILIDMSLLKVNKDGNILEMHDQLRDMGRRIAKGSRIWKASMILKSGFTSKDVEDLEGISLQGTMVQQDFEALEGICGQETIMKQVKSFDFKKLRVLILVPPLDIFKAYLDNLDFLLQLSQQCSQMEAIIIGTTKQMIGWPQALPTHIATNLQKKILDFCGTHASLKILDLIGLGFLEQLPNNFASSHSLLRLNLSFCRNLVALPNEVGNLSSLTSLYLRGCSRLVALPEEVGKLSSLTTLDLTACSRLVALPNELGNLISLTTLYLSFCSSLVALPMEVGNLSSLTNLDLRGCSSLVVLPKEVGNLSSLTILDLRGCSSLAPLPKEVEILNPLTTLQLDGCSSLRIEGMSSLMIPNLDGCSNLVTLPKEIEISSSLMTYNSEECSSKAQVKTIGNDEHLLKEQHEAIVTQFRAKYDLSKNFNDAIQEPFLNLLSFLTNRGLHVFSSLVLWVQICIGMSNPQVLSWNKGKVESKDLLTKRFLGQGCSGFFYETIWLQNRKIKFARKDFPGVTGNTFVMEAIRLFELGDHPNLVKTFCWTVDNRSCSLVMEFMKDDLSSFIRKKKEALRKKGDQVVIGVNPSPFQLLEALNILSQIAIGVEHLHNEGIYHGDLKPNNVFLDWKEGQMLVKVADFGLLKTKKNTTLLSQRALCFRMIEWSAPELFEDFFSSMSEDLDFLWSTSLTKLDPSTSRALCFENGQEIMLEKADSYSFGLTSAYVLGCEQMWPTQFSLQELRKQISSYGLRPNLPSECPKMLASLIYACWDMDPTRRPTFSAIRNKMQGIIREQRSS